MKRFAILLLAVGMTGLVGCATPAYTSKEVNQQVARNWHWEMRQIRDDVDHALLLRPLSHMSIWHLR